MRAAVVVAFDQPLETLCEQQENSGYTIDGAFAEYVVASARFVIPVPDGVSSLDARSVELLRRHDLQGTQDGQDPLVGTGRDLRHRRPRPPRGAVRPHHGRLGGVAIDIEKHKLDLAIELGAEQVVNAAVVDAVAALQAMGGVDVALVLAASPKVFEQAFASLKRGGLLVCVALPAEQMISISIFEPVLKGIPIIGSIVGTRQDVAEVCASQIPARLVFTF